MCVKLGLDQINDNTLTEDGSPNSSGIFIVLFDTSGLRLEVDANTISGITGNAFTLEGNPFWTSGEIDIVVTNNSFSSSALGNIVLMESRGSSATSMQILWDDNDVTANNAIFSTANVEAVGGRIDWTVTNSTFISGGAIATINVQADSTLGIVCVDFNDDGAGGNSTNDGFRLAENGSGRLIIENGTTVAAITTDNPAMLGTSSVDAGAEQEDCIDATP